MKYIKFFFLLFFLLLIVGCSQKNVTITFYGLNNEIISTLEIQKGTNVVYPEDLEIEGYDFLGWSQYIDTAEEDLDIYALLEKYSFSVSFYNENKKLISEQVVEYGDSAIEPNFDIADGYIFLGWDEDFTNVTSDLRVYAKVEKAEFTVTFENSYGEVIETQVIKNGEDAVAPDAPVIEGYEFKKWDKDYTTIKSDIVVKPIYQKVDKGYEMENVNYWIQVMGLNYDMNKLILTPEEIVAYNELIVSDFSKTRTLDVTTISKTVEGTYVDSLINKYTNINKYTVYNDQTNKSLSTSDKDQILALRNLSSIPSTVTVKFGIITDFAWMRTYPTNCYSDNYSMDRFQETTLNVGEGVAIYHESSDGQWYFVQAMNYYGWVQKKCIAECSYDDMKDFLKAENKIVVISDYVILEDTHVRMGQAFPLVSETEDSYKIKFPKRNSDGTAYFKDITITKSDDYNKGYLEYTYKNVLLQAFKLLGIDYSWGDKETSGRDCSSTMAAIYNSFGFMMPRNCTQQRYIPKYGSTVSYVSDTIMKNQYKPGTLIYSSSHVMMYIGENDYGVSYLLHNTNAGNGGCILQALSSYGGNKIIGILEMQ